MQPGGPSPILRTQPERENQGVGELFLRNQDVCLHCCRLQESPSHSGVPFFSSAKWESDLGGIPPGKPCTHENPGAVEGAQLFPPVEDLLSSPAPGAFITAPGSFH